MKNSGFTLTEIVIYIAVSSIIVTAVSGFFLWTSRSNAKAKALREVLNSSRAVMESIAYEVRNAKSVYAATSVFSSGAGQLSLETPHYAQSQESASYIDFFLCNKKVCFKKEGQEPVVLSSDKVSIDSLRFVRTQSSTTDSVQVGLEASYITDSDKPEHQARLNTTSTFSIRQ